MFLLGSLKTGRNHDDRIQPFFHSIRDPGKGRRNGTYNRKRILTEEALSNIAETTVSNILSCFEKDGFCDNELCYRCGHIEQCKKERKEKCF